MGNSQKIYLFAILASVFLIIALIIVYSVIVRSTLGRNSDLCKCKNIKNFDEIRPRIVNGTEVLNNDLPFAASLFIKVNATGNSSTISENVCTVSSELCFLIGF